jgi:hypothetical protein
VLPAPLPDLYRVNGESLSRSTFIATLTTGKKEIREKLFSGDNGKVSLNSSIPCSHFNKANCKATLASLEPCPQTQKQNLVP